VCEFVVLNRMQPYNYQFPSWFGIPNSDGLYVAWTRHCLDMWYHKHYRPTSVSYLVHFRQFTHVQTHTQTNRQRDRQTDTTYSTMTDAESFFGVRFREEQV